jgi:Replication-relaxation
MEARKHRDRFKTKPTLNKRGLAVQAAMIGRQPKILEALAAHATLTIHDIHAVVSGDLRSLRQSVRTLLENSYIRIVPELLRARNVRQLLSYQLAPRGVEWLNSRGMNAEQPRRIYNISHATLVSHITASIATGIERQAGARLITWEEMRAHPKFPRDYEAHDKVRPDTHPVRIELLKDGVPTWRTLVVEADNGTETIKPSKPEKYTGNSIYAKFEAYLEFMRYEEFKKRYGVSNYYVLFVFTSRSRLDNSKALLESMGGSRFILFQQAYQEPETPPGYIFKSACERVGFAPLYLNQP